MKHFLPHHCVIVEKAFHVTLSKTAFHASLIYVMIRWHHLYLFFKLDQLSPWESFPTTVHKLGSASLLYSAMSEQVHWCLCFSREVKLLWICRFCANPFTDTQYSIVSRLICCAELAEGAQWGNKINCHDQNRNNRVVFSHDDKKWKITFWIQTLAADMML